MIKLMFVKSNAPLSKLIMWSTSEPVSHFAIGITLNEGAKDYLVFNSDLLGVRVLWSTDFETSHTVVDEIDYQLTDSEMNDFTQKVIDASLGSLYNVFELTAFGLQIISTKMTKKPIEKTSLFASKRAFICTDIARLLPLSMTGGTPIGTNEVYTPYQLYLRLSGTKK